MEVVIRSISRVLVRASKAVAGALRATVLVCVAGAPQRLFPNEGWSKIMYANNVGE